MKEEEKQPTSKKTLRRFLKKRYLIPALYLGLAAVVLTAVMYYQNVANDVQNKLSVGQKNTQKDVTTDKEDSIAVTAQKESLHWPVKNRSEVKVKNPFYDPASSEEEQESALVVYDNTYYQNKGVDLAKENGEAFEVTAAMSGTVVKAEKDPLFGYVVEVDHGNQVTTRYQSLADAKVNTGQKIKQGEMVGTAGRSVFNKDAGVHVHFELRKMKQPLNPMTYFNKTASELPSAEEMKNDKETPVKPPNNESSDQAKPDKDPKQPQEDDAPPVNEEDSTSQPQTDQGDTPKGEQTPPASKENQKPQNEKLNPSTNKGA